MATIQKNEKLIINLKRQISDVLISEKIWEKIYKNAHNSISRGELAELKYLFVTNYANHIDLFELVGDVCGQNCDRQEVKKHLSDVNIMTRIKDI